MDQQFRRESEYTQIHFGIYNISKEIPHYYIPRYIMRQPSTYFSSKESIREQRYLADHLEVRQDADDGSEQRLDRLGQLCAARVPRVHGDEDAYFAVHNYLLTFKLVNKDFGLEDFCKHRAN